MTERHESEALLRSTILRAVLLKEAFFTIRLFYATPSVINFCRMLKIDSERLSFCLLDSMTVQARLHISIATSMSVYINCDF